VTFDTFDSGVWRILVRGELRMHTVAGGTTELGRLRVFDGTIGHLCSDNEVTSVKTPKNQARQCSAARRSNPVSGSPSGICRLLR
jgi:hypothetical protein